jgi:hypothetical protein
VCVCVWVPWEPRSQSTPSTEFGANMSAELESLDGQDSNNLLTPFWSAKHSTRTVAVPSAQGRMVRAQRPDGPRPGARRGGALCIGAYGPRAGAGQSAAWCKARAPAWRPDGPRPGARRSARARGRRKIAGGTWISLSGGTPSGRRDPRSCLGSGRPT